MPQADKEDRTEAPSARRLARAREEGRVAISRELQTLAGLGVAILALVMLLPPRAERFVLQMRGLMENAARVDVSGGGAFTVLHDAFGSCVMLAGPVVLAGTAGVIAATVVQTGFLLRFEALMPQPGRLNPMKGLKRIVGGSTAVEALKSVLKLAAFSFAVWHVLGGLFPLLMHSVGWNAATLASRMTRLALSAALMVLAVQAVVTMIDVGWERYKHTAELRMSKQELRDEHRESEGDPQVKQRIRRLRRQRAAKRMMAEVAKATVVVTNPTHYAVALVYETGSKAAPRIVAKGMDDLAARIRAVAQDNKVPVVSNPPLARALYTLPLDSEIPREHFQMVAGIIAYVWRLRRPPPGAPPVR